MSLEDKAVKAIPSEEKANTLTHAIGVILCIIGTIALLIKVYTSHDHWQIYSAYIFSGSLLLLYLASTLYHAVSNQKLKGLFHVIDHSAIFVLIAGTYTPFLLVGLRDEIHLSFIIIMWCIATAGIIYKLFIIKKYKLVSTLIYLAMGWMAIFKIETFYHYLPAQALIWILVGGLFYSIGTIFYTKESIRYHHAIWHLFVLCGSVSHFIAIYLYVY
ncbi:MAG: hemolysin III family protein [Cyclobacteriaceae bacterium]|nr:hemolysin III family protein [Cyclobacteriaceae bacterium]